MAETIASPGLGVVRSTKICGGTKSMYIDSGADIIWDLRKQPWNWAPNDELYDMITYGGSYRPLDSE